MFTIGNFHHSVDIAVISQNPPTILQVAVPSNTQIISQEAINQFESQYSDITIEIVEIPLQMLTIDSTAPEAEETLEAIYTLVEQADVLLVNDNVMFASIFANNPIFLNLAPLVAIDERFSGNMFHPIATQAFADSNQVWGIAGGVSFDALFYNREQFQLANLTAPNANWILQDYQAAADLLMDYTEGSPILVNSPGVFLNSLWNQPLTQDDGTPSFTAQGLTDLVDEFVMLRESNVLDIVNEKEQLSDYPLFLGYVPSNLGSIEDYTIVPLSNDENSLFAWGFAVSSGTSYPEIAYDLSVHLATQTDLSQSTATLTTVLDGLDTQLVSYPAEVRAFVDQALSSSVSLRDRFYIEYLNIAAETDTDTTTSLESIQSQALATIETWQTVSDNYTVVVATPIPDFSSGDSVVLQFGIDSSISNINSQEWERLIDEFVAQDSTIDDINLVSPSLPGSFLTMSEASDCFYLASNNIPPGVTERGLIRSLSPLIDADPTFDFQDFVGGSFEQLEYQGEFWSIPLTISPHILQVNAEYFDRLNMNTPNVRWDTNNFEATLIQLQMEFQDETSPMVLPATLSTPSYSLLMLIAAYGGLPIDYRTTPPTIDFTNPTVIDAITIVLDFAREGLINYSPQSGQNTRVYSPQLPPLFPVDFGNRSNIRIVGSGENWVSFPEGQTFLPISYNVGSGYISGDTIYPEACYSWLRTLANAPHLFIGFPAYQSTLEQSVSISTSQRAFITEYINLIMSPNAVIFPTNRSYLDVIELLWLYEAFDNYVIAGSALEMELLIAERRILEFRECTDNIDPLSNFSEEEFLREVQQRTQCIEFAEQN